MQDLHYLCADGGDHFLCLSRDHERPEGSEQQHLLGRVLVLAVSEPDFMQKHFENVLSVRLSSWGIEAVPADKVFSQFAIKLGREAVLEKVREMDIGNVLVARAVGKEEASGLYQEGVYRNPAGR